MDFRQISLMVLRIFLWLSQILVSRDLGELQWSLCQLILCFENVNLFEMIKSFHAAINSRSYLSLVYSLYKELLLLILKKPALVFPPLAHFRHKVKLTFDLSNLASMSKKCRGMGARVTKTTVIFKCPDITTLRDQYRDRCDTLPLVTFLSRGQLRVWGANDG